MIKYRNVLTRIISKSLSLIPFFSPFEYYHLIDLDAVIVHNNITLEFCVVRFEPRTILTDRQIIFVRILKIKIIS